MQTIRLCHLLLNLQDGCPNNFHLREKKNIGNNEAFLPIMTSLARINLQNNIYMTKSMYRLHSRTCDLSSWMHSNAVPALFSLSSGSSSLLEIRITFTLSLLHEESEQSIQSSAKWTMTLQSQSRTRHGCNRNSAYFRRMLLEARLTSSKMLENVSGISSKKPLLANCSLSVP